jgi:predicted alternative tryptophan synthase beta-subunit
MMHTRILLPEAGIPTRWYSVTADMPAPESCHAIAATVREARECAKTGEPKTLLFNLSGHGHFDMTSYDRYLSGELEDFEYPAEAIKASLAHLPKVG